MVDKNPKSAPKAQTPMPEQYIPDEADILRELKQKEKRKQYMQSPKAKVNRKAYQKKRYAKVKADRDAIEHLKATDPARYAELVKKAQEQAAAEAAQRAAG